MAVSTSFHRNVFLLSQIIQPSDEFKKYFHEGMFDKPNTAGFIHISYYLLTIYDSERFKKLIEWPVVCKKSEIKYRNNVKDYLTVISMENPDIGFPTILMSHLIHAGGSKFTIIMWKLSQVVIKKYITRETAFNVMFAPQVGSQGNLTKKFLQESNVKMNSDILKQCKYLSEMESTTKMILEKEKQTLNKVITEIFEKGQLIENLSDMAPVHPSIKKYLKDINDEEVIKMWKKNINKGLNWIQRKYTIFKDIEQLTFKVNNIISSSSSDMRILSTKQFQKINHLKVSELLSSDIQLYKDDKIILNNFIMLLNFLLTKMNQDLKLNVLEDFSECLFQIEISHKDLKTALNVIQTYLTDIIKMKSETEDILCQKNIQIHDDTVLPLMDNTLIMLSPLIKIDTNYSNEEIDLQKRLQLTPVEAAYKSLFSRYERLKQNQALHRSKLRKNVLVSRINFDDTVTSINSEKQPLHEHTVLSRKNLSSYKQTEKYSRLFSTRIKRNNRTANSSIMSIPCSSKANSTIITNSIDETHDISELSLNISTRSLCNTSIEFATPEKLIAKQNKCGSTLEMENMANNFPNKANMIDICETIQVEIKNNYDNNIIKTEQTKQKRYSIGDLVERYKKLLEKSNHTPGPTTNYVKCENK